MASTEQLAKSLSELEHCASESLRQMLLKGLPHAFGGARHAHQVEFAKILGNCLGQEQDLQRQAQEKCVAEADELNTQLTQSQSDLAAAAERVQTARAVVEAKAAELESKRQAAKSEEALYLQVKADKDVAVSEHEKLELTQAEVDSVANGSLQMLVNGGWEDSDSCEDFVSGVCEYLKGVSCEAPLLAALPKALGRRPDERGDFDKIVLEEVVRIFDERVQAITSNVEKDKEKLADIDAADLGAWAIWDIARDSEKAAAKAHKQAQEELEVTIGEKSTVDAKLADSNSLLEKALAAKAITDSKVYEIELSLGELAKLESPDDHENTVVPEPSPKKRKIDDADAVSIAAQ